jgi:hypothetical protein
MKPRCARLRFLPPRVAAVALLLTKSVLGQSTSEATSGTTSDTTSDTPGAQACNCMRTGFHLRVSSGLGYFAIRGNGPSGEVSLSTVGSSVGIAGGGTIVRGLALAGALHAVQGTGPFHGGPFENAVIQPSPANGSAPANAGAEVTLVQFGLLLDWFPNPRLGWHIGAMVAPGGVVVTTLADGADMSSSVTPSGSMFGGYDFCVANNVSLGLMLVASGVARAALEDSDRNETGYRVQAISFALQSSFLFY